MKEVTQESNETFRFDVATHTWEEIGNSDSSPLMHSYNQTPTKVFQSFGNLKKPSLMDTIQPEVTNPSPLGFNSNCNS